MAAARELVSLGASYLLNCGVEEPKANAEFLLAHLLDKKRPEVYVADNLISCGIKNRYLKLLRIRGKYRKPISYIFGFQDFMGLPFQVAAKSTLIPRPETETLVGVAVDNICKHWPIGTRLNILDVGAGTGCIGISLYKLLQSRYQVHLTAIESSISAAKILSWNAKNFGLSRENFSLRTGFFQKMKLGRDFHAVVSNPPYVSALQMKRFTPEISLWEPQEAFDGGKDGLKVIRQLLSRAPHWIRNGGFIAIEVGDGQALRVKQLFLQNGFSDVSCYLDLEGHKRVVTADGCLPN